MSQNTIDDPKNLLSLCDQITLTGALNIARLPEGITSLEIQVIKAARSFTKAGYTLHLVAYLEPNHRDLGATGLLTCVGVDEVVGGIKMMRSLKFLPQTV